MEGGKVLREDLQFAKEESKCIKNSKEVWVGRWLAALPKKDLQRVHNISAECFDKAVRLNHLHALLHYGKYVANSELNHFRSLAHVML